MPLDWNDATIKNLRSSVTKWRQDLKFARVQRLAALKLFGGAHYIKDWDQETQPIPLIAIGMKTYLRHLVGRRPAVMVGTPFPRLKPSAYMLQLAMNQLLKEINFGETMEAIALDAMFGMAFAKIGLYSSREVEIGGVMHDEGQPYFDRISPEDIVYDTNARTWEQITVVGNRYRVPLRIVKESSFFENTDELVSQEEKTHNESGDRRSTTLTRGNNSDYEDFEPHVELLDLYMPFENTMMTLAEHQDNIPPVVPPYEWNGPERGPYRRLSFGTVPDQIMPLAPIHLWMDMHEMVNTIWRKESRRAKNFKQNWGYQPESAKDMANLESAGDLQTIKMKNPEGIREFLTGGANANNVLMAMKGQEEFNNIAGNLNLMTGSGADSETLGQDQILMASSNQTVEDLQDRTLLFTEFATEDLAWFLYYDQNIPIPLIKEVANGRRMAATLSPKDREGDFLEYNFSISPYSMRPQTPDSKFGTMMQLLNGLMAPFAPMMQEQGLTIDMQAVLRHAAQWRNLPEIEDMVTFTSPSQQQQMGPVGESPRRPVQQSPKTERTYNRVSQGAGKQGGEDITAALLQGLGQKQQQTSSPMQATG